MKLARWMLPSPADALFGIVLFTAAVVRGTQAINTDGDFARHLRVGREIIAHGLFFTDKFSWTMAGKPFVPYEWASEVLYALAHRVAGIPGAIVLMGIACAAAYALAYLLLVRRSVDPLLAFLTAIGAAAAGSFHWLARPHVFSLAAIVVVVWLLEDSRSRSSDAEERQQTSVRHAHRMWFISRSAATLIFFCAWANLHAGFLVGLVVISLYLAGELIETAARGFTPDSRAPAATIAILLGSALIGACLNPSGPGVITHLLGFFQMPWLVDITMEMRSPDFHTWYGRTFLLLLLFSICLFAVARPRVQWAHLMVVIGTTALALQSARNIEIWALSGLLIAAIYADAAWRSISWRPLVRARAAFATGAELASSGPWSAAAAIVFGMVALHGGRVGTVQALPRAFDRNAFPVAVVQRAREARVKGRMFNELAWGGYVLYAWPNQKVFIDGQTDFYGQTLAQLYMRIRMANPGWAARLDSLGIESILIPDHAPLAWALASSTDWVVADSADGAVRYSRRTDARP